MGSDERVAMSYSTHKTSTQKIVGGGVALTHWLISAGAPLCKVIIS